MKLSITISMNNAAFEMPGPEVADALRVLADKVEGFEREDFATMEPIPVRDTNGNTVGHARKA